MGPGSFVIVISKSKLWKMLPLVNRTAVSSQAMNCTKAMEREQGAGELGLLLAGSTEMGNPRGQETYVLMILLLFVS